LLLERNALAGTLQSSGDLVVIVGADDAPIFTSPGIDGIPVSKLVNVQDEGTIERGDGERYSVKSSTLSLDGYSLKTFLLRKAVEPT
jgi:hypothetical protein